MTKKCFLIFSALFAFYIGSAQVLKKQTLASQGSSHIVFANNKSYFIQESIGQKSIINTYNSNNYSLRQGFLQPVSASAFFNGSNSALNAIVFPNPFFKQVEIRFNDPVIDILDVTLFDTLGRVISKYEYNPVQHIVIDVDNLSAGNYFLKIKMRSKFLHAKIIKL